MSERTCTKCDGRGVISGFGHVMNGLCFRCDGKGVISGRRSRSELVRERNARRWAEFEAAVPDLAQRIKAAPAAVPAEFFAALYKTTTPVAELAGLVA